MIRESYGFPQHSVVIDLNCGRAKRADDLPVRPGEVRVKVVRYVGDSCVLSEHMDVAAFTLNVDALRVRPLFHQNDPAWTRGIRAHGCGTDRVLDRGELAGTINRNRDVSANRRRCGRGAEPSKVRG